MVRFLVLGGLLLALAACGGPSPRPSERTPAVMGHYKLGKPYTVRGRWYHPAYDPEYDEVGIASWYGDDFHGRATANGEVFDKRALTAAHTTLPLPSIVEVTNLENGRSAVLRINDRGPFVNDRLIDLSEAAARELGFEHQGLAEVRVRFVKLAEARGIPPEPMQRELPPPRPPGRTTVAAKGSTLTCAEPGHFVQAGVFADTTGATVRARQLERLAAVRLDPVVLPDGRNAERLRLGPHAERGRAFDTLARLRKMGYDDAYVVSCAS